MHCIHISAEGAIKLYSLPFRMRGAVDMGMSTLRLTETERKIWRKVHLEPKPIFKKDTGTSPISEKPFGNGTLYRPQGLHYLYMRFMVRRAEKQTVGQPAYAFEPWTVQEAERISFKMQNK